jgi:transposase
VQIAVLGTDLGKNSCNFVGPDETNAAIKQWRLGPESIPSFTKPMPTSIVAMEACRGAHPLGRQLVATGHTVRLISAEYVRPRVKAHKNDDRDAEAVAEAVSRPTGGALR